MICQLATVVLITRLPSTLFELPCAKNLHSLSPLPMLPVGLSLLDWSTSTLLASLLVAVCLPLLLMPLLWPGRRPADRLCAGRHVLITGGSKGLGLSLALECVRRGCSVTVVARNKADLEGALQQLQAAAEHSAAGTAAAEGQQQQRFQALSTDTADPEQVC